jgi:hypothetical protein
MAKLSNQRFQNVGIVKHGRTHKILDARQPPESFEYVIQPCIPTFNKLTHARD